MIIRLFFICLVFVSQGALAAPEGWVVESAPWRVSLRAVTPPDTPGAGWEIRLPDFAMGRADMRDFVLLGLDGKEIALEGVWRSNGRAVLMLAESIPAEGEAMLYFGGNMSRRMRSWSPTPSLLLETRRMPVGAKIATYGDWQNAWKNSSAVDGAAFVPQIFHGGNPFGEESRFLSRYTGMIKSSADGELKFYTLSDDVSYVMIGGRPVLKWEKDQPPPRDPTKIPVADVRVSKGLVKIEYSHAAVAAPGAMALGWNQAGKLANIPPEAWVHSGKVAIGGFESRDGAPVPLGDVSAESYLGYGGGWYVQVRAGIADPGDDWKVEWLWSDGRVDHGPEVRRLWMGLEPVKVVLHLRNGARKIEGRRLLVIPQEMTAASVNHREQLAGFMKLLEREDPSALSESARKAGYLLARDFLPSSQAARWAEAWLAVAKPSAGAWVGAMSLALRETAKVDPKAALVRLNDLSVEARTAMGRELDLIELDVRVFDLKDPMVVGLVAKLVKLGDAALTRLATIRLGDYYLLTGRLEDASRCFAEADPSNEQAERKAPVMDRAHSLAIEDLVNDKHLEDARAKLAAWERQRPAAKIEGDQLFWRARVMFLAGDWGRALQDLETSLKIRPGAPEEIEVLFWQGRAYYELGRKDDALKIWNALMKDYPKHERAEAAKLWAQKP